MAIRLDSGNAEDIESRPKSQEYESAYHTASTMDFGVETYDPAKIEAMFHFNPMKYRKGEKDGLQRTERFIKRFFTVFFFFLKIIFNNWYAGQIWSYLGAEDIDRAQSMRRREHARWVTEKLLELGPTFIKVGQSISTRVDLIRREYIDELSKLQDRVPPFDFKDVRRIITEELDAQPEELFEYLDPTPLAAASLGQVHRARIRKQDNPEDAGQEIVVKVQRPDLAETFYLDLAIVRKLARYLQANTELGRSREWVQIVDEFGKTLFEEIDYIQEGRNADIFRYSFRKNEHIHIPEVYWRYTSHRLIAYEYCPGIKINDIHALEMAELDREFLATTAVKAFFQQILIDGFYHADPHPGNIAVREDGVIILYDFGMIGRLPEKTRTVIVEAFLNIINKKPDHILNNLIELDMLSPSADMDVIRQLIVWALDNYYDIPHEQLNFEYLTDELSDLMYSHPFRLPANFTFMIRSLITLEGVATSLFPAIQFMSVAVDYARNFIGDAFNLSFLVRKGRDILGGVGIGPQSAASRRQTARVRLQAEEWTPIARYVKVGLFLLAFGQILTAFMGIIVLAAIMPQFTPMMCVMVGIITFYGLLMLSTLMMLPASKKTVRFEPTLTNAAIRNSNK